MSNKNEFVISREFDAPRELVFKVWSQAGHLIHWWGPKGFTIQVIKLDFRQGGIFHYCMHAPDGKEMWGKIVYDKIVAPERLEFVASFSDAQGGITAHPLAATWPLEVMNVLTFTEHDGKTALTLRSRPINATEEEINFFESNFASLDQGFTGTFNQLEEYLKDI